MLNIVYYIVYKKFIFPIEYIDPFNECKTKYYTVSESDNKVGIDLTFKNLNMNEPLEILCTTISSTQHDIKTYVKQLSTTPDSKYVNVSNAVSGVDYAFLNQTFKLENQVESARRLYVDILNDIQMPLVEGLKMFTIEIKPVGKKDPCAYANPNIVHVIIDDRLEDASQLGFEQAKSIRVNETDKFLEIPIRRYGDASQEVSVICSTHSITALDDIDYMSRPANQEQSRIHFKRGETQKSCLIEILDDSVFEPDETFHVKLTNLKVDSGPHSNEIRFLNDRTELTVTILNDEDASVVYLSAEVYYTDEPSSSDTSVVKPVTVIRTGDLSRITIVRISTSDVTATAGLDYKPKTELIKFNPGVSALDFEIDILYDEDVSESSESFMVTLGPLDPVSGIFGSIKSASVVIRDSGANKLVHSNADVALQQKINEIYSLFGKPYLKSVIGTASKQKFVSNGEPLTCVHVRMFLINVCSIILGSKL